MWESLQPGPRGPYSVNTCSTQRQTSQPELFTTHLIPNTRRWVWCWYLPQPHRDRSGMLTQAVHHGIQHSGGGRGNPRVLSVEVVCDCSDDGEQHGMYAVFQERNHLRKGLQGPLAHFLVGILKPWGKSIKDLLRGEKSRVCGNSGLAGVGWDPFCIPERGPQTCTRAFPRKKSSAPQRGNRQEGGTDVC